ncbi:pilus assembly protein CpaE [Oceanobacillus limi]|uniref:Pilus assembly protein CpaE n=1 Tax=Oceanobacillus limi TaxID=930131 RepID=A0A1I0DPQ1_9BACI|nr:AAA family ATPase [Oceanobacillus limi]SET34534.1 pilus assembly protein CpaE [Oceanobacillus limi]
MKKVQELFVIGNNEELYSSVQQQLDQHYQLQRIQPEDVKKYVVKIVLILKTENESVLDLAQYILAENPNAYLVYISDVQNFDLLRDLNRLGIMDYLVFPDEEWILSERIKEVTETKLVQDEGHGTAEGFKRGGGKVFTFYSGKGGSGKSLISTAFAQTLKLESTAKVLYIDLNLQYGGSETFLALDSNRSIIDLLPVINELSEHHIRNIAEKEEYSGLEVLVSPRDTEMAERIDDDFILRMIRASKRTYDFIVVDLPSWMDERVFTALEESERIYYTMSYDTIAIRVLKNVENLFKQLGLVLDERMELVINFSGKENELNQKDLERFVTYPTVAKVRRDLKGVQSFLNQGQPLRKELKEKKLPPVAKDIQKWVRSMLK